MRTATLLLPLLLPATFPAVVHAQYDQIIWSDEFNGTQLDLTKWTPQFGDGTAYGLPSGWGNNELQSYTNDPDNLSVADGFLHIVAREVAGGGYTSARIRTLNRAEFLYGRLEASILIPNGQGLWPAFWMLPTNSPYGGWAAGGEIDIMESVNQMTAAHGTIHFGDSWPGNVSNGGSVSSGGGSITGFHEYAIEWDPFQMRWYFDGQLYHTVNSAQWWSTGGPGDAEAPFDWPFHFVMNVAVGGNWPGPPNGATQFPAEMLVDYVRVYVDELPGPYTDHAVPGRIEAENFDVGGAAQGYWDADMTNQGNQYRTDQGVDIEVATEGGFNVGWIDDNEWMQYTVDVDCAGSYLVTARVSSAATGGTFHLELDGANITGPMTVPATGGWQSWTTIEGSAYLFAGSGSTLRFVNDSADDEAYNLNWIEFARTLPGDVDGNNNVNFADLTALLASWNTDNPCADFDGDGLVGFNDLVVLLSNWG